MRFIKTLRFVTYRFFYSNQVAKGQTLKLFKILEIDKQLLSNYLPWKRKFTKQP